MYDVEKQRNTVDNLVSWHFSKHYLEGALPEVQHHGGDVHHLHSQNHKIIVAKASDYALSLSIAF